MILTVEILENLLEKIEFCNIQIVNKNHLIENLKKNNFLKLYLGMEVSGVIHIGHFLPLGILKKFSEFSNCESIILLSDIHTSLNQKNEKNKKLLIENLKKYFSSCKIVIASAISQEFKDYNNFHFSPEFFKKIIQTSLRMSLSRTKKAFTMLTRTDKSDKVCDILYPLLQVSDFRFLNINGIVGGQDQRAIHMSGYDSFLRQQRDKYTFFHTPLLTFKNGQKISKSELNTEIFDFLELKRILGFMTREELIAINNNFRFLSNDESNLLEDCSILELQQKFLDFFINKF